MGKQSQQLARQTVGRRESYSNVSHIGKRNADCHRPSGYVCDGLDDARAGYVPPGRLSGIVHEFIEESDALLGRRPRHQKFRRDHCPAARVGS